jgi:plasmid stabilization system protein ParE
VKRLLLHAVAESEIARAFDWYTRERRALGAKFLGAVIATLDRIADRPKSFPVIHRDLRRAQLPRPFSYVLMFRLGEDTVTVVACVHARRDPRSWQLREPIPAAAP